MVNNTYNCLQCNTENKVKRTTLNKFCNNKCQTEYQFENDILPKFFAGSISTARTLHRCLKHTKGYVCVSCGNDGAHNGKPLSLQLDHKDGDATNNLPSNLRLLCPNCHSQTGTYGARNKGNGRRNRK